MAAISTVGIVIIAGALLPDIPNKGNKIFAPNSNIEKNTQSLNSGDEGDLIGANITGPSGGTTTVFIIRYRGILYVYYNLSISVTSTCPESTIKKIRD